MTTTLSLTTPQERGQYAEQRAQTYLVAQGMSFVQANYSCKMGEIDLIMKEHDTLVFVEVRHRRSAAFGSAIESITPKKQQRLLKTAEYYLMRSSLSYHACRFDVLGITGAVQHAQIEWIKDAFQAGY